MIQRFKTIDKGVFFMLLSALISALNGAVAKILSQWMDPIQVVFYRNFIKVSFTFSKIHLLLLRGVLGGFFSACAYATIKTIKDIYDARLIMLSFMSIGMLIPLALFLFTPYAHFEFHTDIYICLLILFMAVISTVSQWFLTKAYSLSNASIIGVVSYTNIPFALGFGLLLGDVFPDVYTFMGIVLIIVGGVLVSKK